MRVIGFLRVSRVKCDARTDPITYYFTRVLWDLVWSPEFSLEEREFVTARDTIAQQLASIVERIDELCTLLEHGIMGNLVQTFVGCGGWGRRHGCRG